MMKSIKNVSVLLVFLFAISTINAQKLSAFGSSIEKKVGPVTKRVPYLDVVSYLGFAAPGTEDEVKDGKKFYYIYLWIPAVAPELGLRMISPVGKTKVKDAIIGTGYEANKDSKEFFDPYITLERSNVFTKDGIAGSASATWTTLAKNDDSSEMPKQPSGSQYNSLLRYESNVGDPLKALTAGLYRIGFTTYKTGEVNGTFLAEVGSPIKLPGVVMSNTIDGLLELMK
ncbi:LipL32 family surface lipoprotein [Formosa sp. PL04]|uniref:LipL32 family surface lipoprotein n=1 Tax=Formosa sp. PL04 TaxID=3081755 RepID=UPI002981E3F5|nr:LipL32 family surface lipoprotein [Formosa sp. PL04]MDW5289635.1 LipL32 family surface lipoprotein [Formosa sp. PL04]